MITKIIRGLTQAGIEVDEHTTAMLAYWDQDLICKYANRAYIDWFGIKPSDMIDKMHISELLGPLYKQNQPYIEAALEGHVQVFRRDIVSPYGQTRHSLATYWPVIEDEIKKGFYVHVEEVPLKDKHPNQFIPEKPLKFIEIADPIAAVEKSLHSCILNGFPGIVTLAQRYLISEMSYTDIT